MANPRNVLGHFLCGQLAAFARLRALRHLDFQFLRMDQIIRGNAESPRSYLLDLVRRLRLFFVQLRIFPAFAGIAPATDTIHRDGERFMRFLADRTVAHGARFEALHDALD